MAGELPVQTETEYEKLLEQIAKHLYETMYLRSGYQRENSWDEMDADQRYIYHDWAMNAIGKMLGPGKWKRIVMSNSKDRVVFVRTDK